MTAKRVLIVDDEDKVVFFLREALSGTGSDYEVVGVRSAADALPQVCAQHFDLLVTDQRMPGMTGIELLEQVRQCSPDTKLIIMTAYGTPELMDAAQRLKVVHFFNKPFRVQELIDVVQQELGILTVNRLGPIELSEDQRASLTAVVSELRERLDARYVMLIDTMGQPLANAGAASETDSASLATLIAGDYITNVKMAQRFQIGERFHFKYYGGETFDVVSAGVNDQALLGLVLPAHGSGQTQHIMDEVEKTSQWLREILGRIFEGPTEAPLTLSAAAHDTMPISLPTLLPDANAHSLIGAQKNFNSTPTPGIESPNVQAEVETVYKLLALEAVRERKRLAREIHDGPTQIFINAIFAVDFMEEMLERNLEEARTEFANLKETFRQGLEEMRRFMFDLRLPMLDAMTLPEALGWLCADFQKRTKVEVLLSAESIQGRLPSHVEGTILKVVQEALHNIQKHARASLVTVSAQRDDDHLTLLIADNGKGFNLKTGSRESGVGLGSMEERIQMLKGTLKLESAPGKGTRIWVTVPMDTRHN